MPDASSETMEDTTSDLVHVTSGDAELSLPMQNEGTNA